MGKLPHSFNSNIYYLVLLCGIVFLGLGCIVKGKCVITRV